MPDFVRLYSKASIFFSVKMCYGSVTSVFYILNISYLGFFLFCDIFSLGNSNIVLSCLSPISMSQNLQEW